MGQGQTIFNFVAEGAVGVSKHLLSDKKIVWFYQQKVHFIDWFDKFCLNCLKSEKEIFRSLYVYF